MRLQIQQNMRQTDARVVAATDFATPIRIVWLQPLNSDQIKSQTLLTKLHHRGLEVQLCQLQASLTPDTKDAVARAHLILISVTSRVASTIDTTLTQIRNASWAPVVLLADSHSLEWAIATLSAGADAVMSMTTPDDVIMARCAALLRRWPPAS